MAEPLGGLFAEICLEDCRALVRCRDQSLLLHSLLGNAVFHSGLKEVVFVCFYVGFCLFVWFFVFVFFPFLGLLPWHMEMPMLGV